MSGVIRRRLGSVGDSVPASDSSEGTASETCDINQDWSSTSIDQHRRQQQHQTHVQSMMFMNSSASGTLVSDIDNDGNGNIDDNGVVISETERVQIESFFSGLGTEIYVSSSLANLYENTGKDDWRLIYTGIPVLLHDKGSARSRSIPRVTFCMAERGSCFALWRDIIDNLSDYRVAGPAFHTMRLSSNHRQIIGFSFDSSDAARELWQEIEKLVSNPENIALSVPGRKCKNKQQQQKRQKPTPLPPKSQISHPCQFHHVTSVTPDDTERYYSLQAFVARHHQSDTNYDFSKRH